MMAVRREAMDLTDTRLLLNRLSASVRSDGASPRSFALLLSKAFEERAWEKEGFGSFRSFMTAPEPDGLGMTKDKLLDAARLADVEGLALRLLREEIPAAAPAIHPGSGRGNKTLSGTHGFRQDSHNADAITARLKRDDPDLAERVVRGEMSPNAAAREKGWRKPRIVLSSPERVAESLCAYMSRDGLVRLLARLAELLSEDDSPQDSPQD